MRRSAYADLGIYFLLLIIGRAPMLDQGA